MADRIVGSMLAPGMFILVRDDDKQEHEIEISRRYGRSNFRPGMIHFDVRSGAFPGVMKWSCSDTDSFAQKSEKKHANRLAQLRMVRQDNSPNENNSHHINSTDPQGEQPMATATPTAPAKAAAKAPAKAPAKSRSAARKAPAAPKGAAKKTAAPKAPARAASDKQTRNKLGPQGWLQDAIKQVATEFADGTLDTEGKPLTPHRIAKIVGERHPNTPSSGAVAACLARWKEYGFAKINEKPVAFVAFTAAGKKEGLDALVAKHRQAAWEAKKG